MKKVICSSCNAGFEVDFDPGTEFTCGACGAVVIVPEAPVPPKRVAPSSPPPRSAPPARPAPRPAVSPRPAPAARPAPARAAPAPRPDRPPRRALAESAAPEFEGRGAAAKKQKTIMWIAIGGTVLVLAVLGVLMMLNDDTKGGPSKGTPSSSPSSSAGAPSSTTPADVPASRAAPPPPSRGVRPTEPLAAAKYDAEEPGAGSAKLLAFADMAYERAEQLEGEGKRDEAASLRRDALATYTDVIKTERNQERARERLGYVKFDPEEAKRLAGLAYLSKKLKSTITETIEQIEEKTKGKKVEWPLWLSMKGGSFEDIASDWRNALRDAKAGEALESAKKTDSFYQRAANLAQGVEGDVGPALKKRGLEGATFDAFPQKPFAVMIQRDKDYDTQAVADYFTALLMQLRETFLIRFKKLNLPAMDRPTPLLVLHYNTDYAKYLRRGDKEGGSSTPISSQAHFEPWSKRLVVWKDPDRTDKALVRTVSEEEVRTVLFHEGTHQLVDYYTKTRPSNLDESLWFSEGIADYFGGHARTWDENAGKWRYEPGLINTERVDGVGNAKAGNYLFKIRDLLAYRRGDYEKEKNGGSPRPTTAYAQGWALVYFLSNWDDNKYRDKFDEYVKKEMNGESGVKAFEDVFGAGSMDTIEKGLHEMIDVLYQAHKDKKIINGKLKK